ncbi:hypothetical protein EUX98_g5257 [Antrodiella citrinella]|uniref:NAD-dependent epimerase/dehydratase domain-containing protein n=1 Tax=Antrodiella citrinella TaxID=2447956 RepID=A0A4V3XIF0_9APHY|nr:hypothetical protein EUX98_g5257 [Antrodiella citrinella]
MSQKSLVLVTGVSGYLGSHVINQLVIAGYRVRGTVRSAKVPDNKKAFAVYGDAVEIIAWDDLVHGTHPEAFKGVDAVIHVAAPLVGREATAELAISVSVDGSLNIIRQAEQAGIKNFGYVSSVVAVTMGFAQGQFTPVTDQDWVPITKETVLSNKDTDKMTVYVAEKVLSERAVWEFVDQHPHIELATVNPPFFFGPFAPGHRSPFEGNTFNAQSISTTDMLWGLIKPSGAHPLAPCLVDVRDVARALVAALKAPPTSEVGRKRILLSGEWRQLAEIAELVATKRPELASRIPASQKTELPVKVKPMVDNTRLKEILGLEVTPWETTVLDTIDALVNLEKEWKARGVDITAQ